ncbi:class I SAM-dependent methyltransferase [Clostridium sp. 19966]|uniref:class I SAM-dependent methyltransferase n=1 Tax=Clostridium sp. 19966 TaxID=2768166 RepID=UPI0028DECB39|nr:methyltransferase domain-containing protein [Clostridium sp. 19966]MDT8719284.1 class I SAM-dependent methyltransferase [Clostridium sp. 19966]
MKDVADFYESYDEDNRLSKDNARKIEFTMTVNLLNQYIKPKDKILELGAGTGAYSFYYARKGNSVEALDLTPKHIKIINEKISKEKGKINIRASLGDASNLQDFKDESFDAVNCLGPMYHIQAEEKRIQCINEALRVLKPKGILAISYINKHFIIQSTMANQREFFTDSFLNKILTLGVDKCGSDDCFFPIAFFTAPEEIQAFISKFPLEIIDHAAIDGTTALLRSHINELNEAQYATWINYCLKTCRDKNILGLSNHGMIICRKKSAF